MEVHSPTSLQGESRKEGLPSCWIRTNTDLSVIDSYIPKGNTVCTIDFIQNVRKPKQNDVKPKCSSSPKISRSVHSRIPSIMPSEKKPRPPSADQDAKDLQRLLDLLNTPASKQQLPSIDFESSSSRQSLQWPTPQPKGGQHQHQSTEALTLEQFSSKYASERSFSSHDRHQYFTQLFSALVQQRLCNVDWSQRAPPENILRVLVCLRILMRDPSYQKKFFDLQGVKVLSENLHKATESYMTYGDGPFVVDILKEMTNIFQKLSAVVEQREWLVACGAHKSLVLLLSATDVIVLHCSIHALTSLAQSPQPRSLIGELNAVETLLRILHEYDSLSKKLAANLLRILCADSQVREMVKLYDGIPIMLSLLHSDNVKLLWNIVWCLVQLSENADTSNDIRMMGGIPLLLSLLQDRKYVPERSSASSGPASAAINGRTPISGTFEETEELNEHQLSLKSACCAALTELVLNDTNAQHLVQANGVYMLGMLILRRDITDKERKPVETLQKNAFRTLRFLFSMERNRQLFKRIFPAELFEKFIDIGHYIRDINSYKPLVDTINSLPAAKIEEMRDNIVGMNHNREPSKFIGEYAILEHLGTGAFGSVYKVMRKTAGQSYLAMKEINILASTLGKNAKDREKSAGDIISELKIIQQQLKHPSVVRYYKTFVQDEKLYIVMELIEGAPIGEYFNSLKEKKERFTEERIWNIFIQLVLALRYLHKEKGIVHRDLTPNNIMLGENDKVTITDFGLAKIKQADTSKMTSVVGTILYCCPEIVQSQPYSEKSDVWAIGCILYQMCTLKPPFYSSNMLTLAKTIVEAEYEPIPTGIYSDKVAQTIQYCLQADPVARPDIVQVAGMIADIIMTQMDTLRANQLGLEKKLDRERKRTQKHFYEANKNMQNYHRLFLASQERYDKLVNLAGSGGAASLKDGEISDGVFSDSEIFDKLSQFQRAPSFAIDDQNNNDKGWVSDDDSYPSSGSDSRESSNGMSTFAVPKPPRTPRGGREPRRKLEPFAQQLSLDVSGPKSSRDSGISSGDPSPSNSSPPKQSAPDKHQGAENYQRSLSYSSVEGAARRANSGGIRRPNSATKSATLTISPRKVRQISDPILQMLNQLHKIIYITQLPPTLCPNHRRRVIERFKKALFAPQSTSFNLKTELKKLLNGSREFIDLNFGIAETSLLTKQANLETEALTANSEKPVAPKSSDADAHHVGITYEQMNAIIESVLVECGYYDMSPNAQHRRMPLAPIGQDILRIPTAS